MRTHLEVSCQNQPIGRDKRQPHIQEYVGLGPHNFWKKKIKKKNTYIHYEKKKNDNEV